MFNLKRTERLIRSKILGSPFVAANWVTRFEVHGQEHLLAALARRHRTGRGLITISNHQSLFDDPIVLMALLGISDFTVESKCWWSTPCQANFNPQGRDLRSRFVRYFSDVSNMVFFTRAKKHGAPIALPHRYLPALEQRGGKDLVARVEARAMSLGISGETYLQGLVTPGDPHHLAALNQTGMIEAIARINTGDWLHFFPEGTRSRTLDLGPPRKGVGKALYFCPEAEVIPIGFCGMHDVLPISATLPRPWQRVVVTVGQPVPVESLEALRRQPALPETFQSMAEAAWNPVQAIWPDLLLRHFDRSAPASFTWHRPTHAAGTRIPSTATTESHEQPQAH